MMEPVKRPDGVGWMPVFAGLMAVLLCFFIALYVAAGQETRRLTDRVVQLQGALSMMATRPAAEPTEPPPPPDEAAARAGLEALTGFVEAYLLENDLPGEVLPDWESASLTLRFPDSLFFEAGAAGFDSEAYRALNALARLLVRYTDCFGAVRVEGHTDRTPPAPGSPYRDNWELSHLRAAGAARYLYQTGLIEPERLSGLGCGEFRPIDDGDANRNRRMDFVLENLSFDALIALSQPS